MCKCDTNQILHKYRPIALLKLSSSDLNLSTYIEIPTVNLFMVVVWPRGGFNKVLTLKRRGQTLIIAYRKGEQVCIPKRRPAGEEISAPRYFVSLHILGKDDGNFCPSLSTCWRLGTSLLSTRL
jgi:hypothetical protein